MKKIVFVLISAFIGGVIGTIIYKSQNKNETSSEFLLSPRLNYTNNFSQSLPDFTYAAELAVPAVVHVKTEVSYTSGNIFDFFFGYAPQTYTQKLPVGSGVIVSSDGYIVTNNHVIINPDNIEVSLWDKRSFKAKLIATDPSIDIALLKIDAENLPYLNFGNSDELRVGEWVLAVGNPFNLTSTVTAGIVSAKARKIGLSSPMSLESFIQTDAAVNPGNSGGALVNIKGELVGINTAIASQTGSYIGYAFAIPSNIVKKAISDFIKYGEVQRAYLGVIIQSITDELRKQKNLSTTMGVYVEDVTPGGSAQEAGIKPGDIIVKINDVEIRDIPQLQEQIGQFEPGQSVKVEVLREGKVLKFDVILKNYKNNTTPSISKYSNVLGAKLKTIEPSDVKNLKIKEGVQVVEIKPGLLQSIGIQKGFIITSINGTPVKKAEEVELLLNKIKGNVTIEGIYPNGMYAYYSFIKK
ncbi:MAG: Do family serine endopeptidase [Bacteroidales bacterium]|nr:Do family serine endopeptidase [Bacteroidales bacterium]